MTDLTQEAVWAALEAATPGPWQTGIDLDTFASGTTDVSIAIGRDDFDPVALAVNEDPEEDCRKSDVELVANAHLIAMAPDLARAYLEQAAEIARLKRVEAAGDELAETHKAMLRMMDDAIKGTGKGDMAISPDHRLTLVEAWKRDAAYRAAKEAGNE